MDGSGTRKALPRIGRPTTWNKKARKLFLCVRRPLAHLVRSTCLDRPGVPEIGAISTTVWVNSPMNEKKQPADYRDGDQCCSRDLRFLRDWSPHNMDHHDGEPSVRPERLIGKLDDQSNRWEGEYPTQALGRRQVAPHERWRAQRARSEALAKRDFLILNWGIMISRHLVIAHLVGEPCSTAGPMASDPETHR